MFISFEGGEATGKSTQIQLVKEQLEEEGFFVHATREPGGSDAGESIRSILLSGDYSLDTETEALLLAANRRHHYYDVIEPKLKKGHIILCDRYVDSSIVYQGMVGNVGKGFVESLNHHMVPLPERTYILTVSTEEAQERLDLRGRSNHLDYESDAFFESVNYAYHQIWKENPKRCHLMDAHHPPDELANYIAADIIKHKEISGG